MKPRMTFSICLVAAFFLALVAGADQIGARSGEAAQMSPPALENSGREEYLIELYNESSRKAEKHGSEGDYLDAVAVMKKAWEELNEEDYEEFPIIVAAINADFSHLAELGASLLLDDAIKRYEDAIGIYEKTGHYALASIKSSFLAHVYEDKGRLEQAEMNFGKAVSYGEMIARDDQECTPNLAIHYRERHITFYGRHGRFDEASVLSKELASLQNCPGSSYDEFAADLDDICF